MYKMQFISVKNFFPEMLLRVKFNLVDKFRSLFQKCALLQ